MNHRTRGATLATLGSVLVLAGVLRPMAASADDRCPVIDPGCVSDTVDDLVGGTTDSVDDVGDIVADVGDGATGVVKDVVDDTIGLVPDDPGDGGGGAGDGGGGTGDGGGASGDDRMGGNRSDPTRGQRDRVGSSSFDDRQPARSLPSVAMAGAGAGLDPRAVASGGPTVGTALVRTAAGMAVMLILLGLVTGFVSFQHALDRRDPKLAPATLGSDRVPFR